MDLRRDKKINICVKCGWKISVCATICRVRNLAWLGVRDSLAASGHVRQFAPWLRCSTLCEACTALSRPGHAPVDVLGAVVGMEALDGEREQREQPIEHRYHLVLRDRRRRADVLLLSPAAYKVAEIHALDPVEVVLVNSVHPDMARLALRLRRPALADRGFTARSPSRSVGQFSDIATKRPFDTMRRFAKTESTGACITHGLSAYQGA